MGHFWECGEGAMSVHEDFLPKMGERVEVQSNFRHLYCFHSLGLGE